LPTWCPKGVGDCDDSAASGKPVNPGGKETCGNSLDDDCANGPDDGCCPHDLCTNGVALDAASCEACVATTCTFDTACCATGWDGICQLEAAVLCPMQSCGACIDLSSPFVECGAGRRCHALPDGSAMCIDGLGAGGQDASCSTGLMDDCESSMACIVDDPIFAPYCAAWCADIAGDSDCPAGYDCRPFTNMDQRPIPLTAAGAITVDGTEWGYCF
jgi:hypothetical protein